MEAKHKTFHRFYLPATAPRESTIKNWYCKLRQSELSPAINEHSGRPKTVVTDEVIKKKAFKGLEWPLVGI